jgi:G:T-mismatch repair DNA endonuclease (very short patch repair protein)
MTGFLLPISYLSIGQDIYSIMDENVRKKIISEYKKGKSSLEIVKIVNLSKQTILKVLNKENIIRKRNRCDSLDIKNENDGYSVIRKCPKCGQNIKTFSKDRVIACRNHFKKLDGTSLCKPCSLSLQVGKGNPFYGKKHKEDTKNKISKSREGKCVGENNSMSKKEWRDKSRKALKEKWNNGEMEHTRKIMSEKLKETRRLGKIKSTITSKKEKEIVEYLNGKGYISIQSYRVDTKICDIYIPSLNLIIEYFGDYWHCNPLKYKSDYYNVKKGKYAWELWEYDVRKLELIKSYGYNLEVIWERDLKNNNKLIENIISKYDAKLNSTPERSRKD